MVPDRTYHASRFIFSSFFSLIYFLFVPCGGLSWLHISFLLHVKYTISYGKARNRVNASWEIMLSFSFALDKHNGQSMQAPSHWAIYSSMAPPKAVPGKRGAKNDRGSHRGKWERLKYTGSETTVSDEAITSHFEALLLLLFRIQSQLLCHID